MLNRILQSRWTFVLGFAFLALFLLPTPERIGALMALTLTAAALVAMSKLEQGFTAEEEVAIAEEATLAEEAALDYPRRMATADGRTSSS